MDLKIPRMLQTRKYFKHFASLMKLLRCKRHLSITTVLSQSDSRIAHVENSAVQSTVKIPQAAPWHEFIEASDDKTCRIMEKDMLVYENFITEEEEKNLLKEIERYMKRLRYEFDHWDDAIHGFRETEKSKWQEENKVILHRVRELAFPPGTPQIAHVHVLDLAKSGYIKPHVDSVRFCGNTIAGLSLLSSGIMRLVGDKDQSSYADVLLHPRSLYVMRNRARYEYTHEVLKEEDSIFRGKIVPRDRRISVICRNEPETDKQSKT